MLALVLLPPANTPCNLASQGSIRGKSAQSTCGKTCVGRIAVVNLALKIAMPALSNAES